MVKYSLYDGNHLYCYTLRKQDKEVLIKTNVPKFTIDWTCWISLFSIRIFEKLNLYLKNFDPGIQHLETVVMILLRPSVLNHVYHLYIVIPTLCDISHPGLVRTSFTFSKNHDNFYCLILILLTEPFSLD